MQRRSWRGRTDVRVFADLFADLFGDLFGDPGGVSDLIEVPPVSSVTFKMGEKVVSSTA